jgi:hypothetical protein
MAARKRREGELYDDYRKNLIEEQHIIDRKLQGIMGYVSIKYKMRKVKNAAGHFVKQLVKSTRSMGLMDRRENHARKV